MVKRMVSCAVLATGLVCTPASDARAQGQTGPYTKPLAAAVANPLGNSRIDPARVAAQLRAPAGFRVGVWAVGLGNPRMLAVGDDGTVYVTRRDSGDVLALRDDGTGRAGPPRKVVTDLPHVHGIALHGSTMYLATIHEIYVADMRADGSVGAPRAIVTDLPEGAQHPNRTIGIGPDGMLYVTVGSTCNACIETNRENATVLRMATDGSRRGVFAHGLRNTIGFGWHPATGAMWGLDHGTDWRGNDTPPEELNEIQAATHYGWPFCYGRRVIDSLYIGNPPGSTKEALCPVSAAAVLTYQAHSAPLQGAFYTGTQFPAGYRNDMFVAMRGSWNRQPATGYKVVRVRFRDGRPVAMEDFVTGFLSADRRLFHARIAGLAMARDGSLLVGDDTNGVIYRITYAAAGSR